MRTASDLLARSHAGENFGPEGCHWCGSPCTRTLIHDDPYPILFQKTKTFARNRNSIYVCTGCWTYRWKKVTVRYLTGGYVDGSTLSKHSWLMTLEGTFALKTPETARESLYKILLEPPAVFALSFLEVREENWIQSASLNFLSEVRGDTVLKFTVDNAEQSYTPYDLRVALETGNVPSPGVATLIRMVGEWGGMLRAEDWKPAGVTPQGGRPKVEEDQRKRDVTGSIPNLPGLPKKRRAG